MAVTFALRSPLSASVTAAINYYRCAMQYPADGAGYYKDPIKVPVLSLFGTADKYLSVASAKGTQRYVETLRQEFLEGVGHWVQMESPDQVNKIMSDYLLE
jgi:pimeloyl-ACP methyl ester carboxylesterase